MAEAGAVDGSAMPMVWARGGVDGRGGIRDVVSSTDAPLKVWVCECCGMCRFAANLPKLVTC